MDTGITESNQPVETLTNGTVTSSQPDEFVQNNVDDDEKNSLLSETPTGLKTKAKKSKTSRQRRGKSNRSHQSKRSTKTKDQFENEDNNKAITTEYAGLTRFEAQMFNWAQKPTTQQPHTIERDDGNIHNSDSDVILINSPAQSPFIQQKLKPKEELKRNDDIKSPSIIAKSNEQPIDTITSTVNVETKITDNLPETKCIETIEKEVCSSSNDSHPHSQEKTISRTTTPRAQIALETPSSVASPAQLLPPPPLIHIEALCTRLLVKYDDAISVGKGKGVGNG
ncbi:unnamed protein product [Didymodactylos carnosus]|uniref:Uncharacterized protein n=1 Tax=Didymodactylos carnosus TaxID=1234261 RepID=A0A8S2VE44_9BILA|nr:unnamed protein product [Didymodactylos carnosus]